VTSPTTDIIETTPPAPSRKGRAGGKPFSLAPVRWGDKVFHGIALSFSASILILTAGLGWSLWTNSALSRKAFGWGFLIHSVWDPVAGEFGALPFLYGTLLTSFLALLIAVPLGVGAAVFLSELAPRKISDAMSFLIELLAAVPSVIYGLLGIFVLVPFVRTHLQPILGKGLGFLPFFSGPPYGIGFLSAGLILAIMIIPFIITVTREVMLSTPTLLREAVLSLGATRWEMATTVVIPFARGGIAGAVFLALARALGETMAVTMVIGNTPTISASLFSPGYTMAAVLANEFTEATETLYLHALIEVGLVLFGVTLLINAGAQLLMWGVRRRAKGKR
jgi:phosphate transport system permease protein